MQRIEYREQEVDVKGAAGPFERRAPGIQDAVAAFTLPFAPNTVA